MGSWALDLDLALALAVLLFYAAKPRRLFLNNEIDQYVPLKFRGISLMKEIMATVMNYGPAGLSAVFVGFVWILLQHPLKEDIPERKAKIIRVLLVVSFLGSLIAVLMDSLPPAFTYTQQDGKATNRDDFVLTSDGMLTTEDCMRVCDALECRSFDFFKNGSKRCDLNRSKDGDAGVQLNFSQDHTYFEKK